MRDETRPNSERNERADPARRRQAVASQERSHERQLERHDREPRSGARAAPDLDLLPHPDGDDDAVQRPQLSHRQSHRPNLTNGAPDRLHPEVDSVVRGPTYGSSPFHPADGDTGSPPS